MRILTSLALLLAACPPLYAQAEKPKVRREPLTPEQARAAFRIDKGLRVELVACEPQVESPVAMAFDEDGRLWVVEMRDYPNGPPKGQKPQGRIRLLEDRDGDGRYERSTVFADGLLFANGLLPWRGGVIVTAAPHILYLKDTDGDGKADRREVWYEGFATENPQLRVSHPVLGLDGWVYVANGLRGGKVIRAGEKGTRPVDLSGMDFRFDPLTGRHEAISGMGQYGNCFDDWGRRFVCDNRHHLRHIVIEDRYLKRNPYLAAPGAVEDISELDEGPLSSGGKIYPLSRNWTTSNLHVGRFTAACSVFIYRGQRLGEKYRGAAFTCDPTGNLVHMEVLEPHGATFRSKPAQKGVEFLATPDDWTRPVFLAHGPDGALYVVDMCRAVIEHPEFMPPELQKRSDLEWGKDRGRIWRIVPEDHPTTRGVRPNLGKVKTEELRDRFLYHNGWLRMTAHRLMLERQPPADLKWPEPFFGQTLGRDEYYRLHTSWLLQARGELDAAGMAWLLGQEKHPRVEENLVRLAEPWLSKSKWVREGVLSRARHDDARVRFQVALSLGEWDDDRILDPLAEIALRGADDRWTRLAVASSVPRRAGALIATLMGPRHGLTEAPSPGPQVLLRELAALVGARRDAQEVAGVLDRLLSVTEGKEPLSWQMTGLDGLAEGMGRRGTQLGAFLKSLPAAHRSTADRAGKMLTNAAGLAADSRRPLPERLTALRLLAHMSWETAGPALGRLLTEDPVQEVRLGAVRSLAAHPRPEVAGLLLKSWRAYTPALRREVTEVLLRQPDRILALLDEVEAGRVKAGDLDAQRARQLLGHGNPKIRERARKLLQASLPADRKEVLARYRAALTLKGDAPRGKAVFQKHCATCHRLAGVGVDVGPDISDTRTKTLDALLTDVLNPNAAIDSNYVNYLVTTKSGKVLSGMIAAETAGSLTLKRAENQTDVVLREDVDEITSSGVSLMPEALEKGITVEEMADLLAFLKNWRYLEGDVPPSKTP